MNFEEFLDGCLNESLARTIDTDMKNAISFKHSTQVGWIGAWKGIDPLKTIAVMPPFSGEDTYDGMGDYDIYKTKPGEVLARLGNDMTNVSGTSNVSMVKLNLTKGTIAFLKDYNTDDPEWEGGMKFGFFKISTKGLSLLKMR